MSGYDAKAMITTQQIVFACLIIAIAARRTLAKNWSGAVAILLKLHDEEEILISHFSEEYLTYKQHTKTLIPCVW
jgi:protein-S-isoprenylcysteine O-methyltransferase Ste14